jgi:hypothetical protein
MCVSWFTLGPKNPRRGKDRKRPGPPALATDGPGLDTTRPPLARHAQPEALPKNSTARPAILRAAAALLTSVSWAAKSRLSRSSTLGTHTRSIQAHAPAAQSSPPRPLWLCIADRESRLSKGLARDTQPLGDGVQRCGPLRSDNPPACNGFCIQRKKHPQTLRAETVHEPSC